MFLRFSDVIILFTMQLLKNADVLMRCGGILSKRVLGILNKTICEKYKDDP